MGLESATYIDGLNASNPTSGDTIGQADNHIRLIKQVIKATFPSVTGAVTATHTELNALSATQTSQATTIAGIAGVPQGAILLWSGATSAIPSGYVICDGQNSTPDLRDRFVVGAGSTYAVAASGGAASVTTSTSGSHNHGGTVSDTAISIAQMPAHTHTTEDQYNAHETVGFVGNQGAANDQVFSTRTVTSSSTGGGGTHTHTITSDSGHSHTAATLPPYYALAYIMKT